MAVWLAPLASRLTAQPHLGGAKPGATDLAMLPFLRQFAAVKPEWFAGNSAAELQAWLTGWLNSRLFETSMLKLATSSVVDVPALKG